MLKYLVKFELLMLQGEMWSLYSGNNNCIIRQIKQDKMSLSVIIIIIIYTSNSSWNSRTFHEILEIRRGQLGGKCRFAASPPNIIYFVSLYFYT